jgi:hypothetical protein
MQNEIKTPRELLDETGRINGEGYAVLPHWRYRRSRVRAPWWRVKEWDYYAVLDQDSGFGVTITASDLGYVGLFALCLVDLASGRWEQVDTLTVMPAGRTGFAETADGDNRVRFRDNKLYLELIRDGERRILRFASEAFRRLSDGAVSGEISLRQPSGKPRMAIATSWKVNRRAFYYNQKINCMPAEGYVRIGSVEHPFSSPGSFGTLDWGRGNWTYRNRWYWASASGMLEGVPFGFNLGYGFSDRSPASENMLFFNNLPHKLEDVEFRMDCSDYMKPWLFTSSDGRFEAEFTPALDRRSRTDLLLIKSVQHQCFGHFSGTAVLDDGSRLNFDRLPGFAEDVYNRW